MQLCRLCILCYVFLRSSKYSIIPLALYSRLSAALTIRSVIFVHSAYLYLVIHSFRAAGSFLFTLEVMGTCTVPPCSSSRTQNFLEDDSTFPRVLRSTSGNLQSGLLDNGDFPEKMLLSEENESGSMLPQTAPSRLSSAAGIRLQQRRMKKLRGDHRLTVHQARSSKYQQYIGRQRRDRDERGDDVWSERLEEAFLSGQYLPLMHP